MDFPMLLVVCALGEVKELDRKILQLQSLRVQEEANATRLNKLVVQAWGTGTK